MLKSALSGRAKSMIELGDRTGPGRLRDDLASAIDLPVRPVARRHRRFDALTALGAVLLERGRPDAALPRLNAACDMWPRDPQAQANRALALLRLGRWSEALSAYDAALELQDELAPALIGRAACLRSLGRFDEAEAELMKAIRVQPDRPEAMLDLGALNELLRRWVHAFDAYDMAVKSRPDCVEGYAGRARALCELVSFDAAIADYDRALALQTARALPARTQARALASLTCERAAVVFALGRHEDAVQECRMAAATAPGFVAPLNWLSLFLHDLGRADEAREAIKKAILLEPKQARHYHKLASVTRFRPTDPELAAMERLAAEIAQGGDEEIELRFALGKARSDIGDFEGAFANWKRGNALVRERRGYDESQALGQMTGIRALFTREFLAARSRRGLLAATPIFVVGMPRSGSTLIEQILSSHPDVFGAGETDDFAQVIHRIQIDGRGGFRFPEQVKSLAPPHFAAIGAEYMRVAGARARRPARILDKTLNNSLYVGLIHLALPNARIIHIRRDPMECCFSCFRHNFEQAHPYAYDLAELGRYFRAHDALMAHWREVLPAGALIEIDHESVVDDLETQTRRLLEHCGLAWDPACLAFHESKRPVRTASAVQVREKIQRRPRPAWLDYAEFLQPLRRELGTAAPA